MEKEHLDSVGGTVKFPNEFGPASLMDDPVVQLLLSGRAETVAEAERIYLEEHLDGVVSLVDSPLSDEEFRRHPRIEILLRPGSRGWEDSIL